MAYDEYLNKPQSYANGIVWFGLFLYPFFFIVTGALFPGAWVGFAAAIGFLILCISVFRWSKLAFILLLPLIVYKISSFVSLILISLGYFIPEIGRYGEADLSPATYLVVTSLHFFLIVIFAMRWIGPQTTFTATKIYRFPAELDLAFLFIFGIIIFQVGVLIFSGVSNGFPLLIGMDRFVYRGLNAGGSFINILNYKSSITLLSAMIISSPNVSHRRKTMVGIGYSLLFTMYILFGEKFHALILASALFSLPFLARNLDLFGVYLKKALSPIILILLLALGLVYYVYSDYGSQTAEVTFERMFGRMAQQSQLWYLATRSFSGAFQFDSYSLASVWQSLFIKGADSQLISLGIASYYFIFRFSPDAVQQSVYEMQGLNQFTQVSEAYWLSVAGLPGLFCYLLISAVIYSAVMVLLVRSLVTTNFIMTYLWSSVFVFMMTSLNQGLPHQIFGRDYLRWYVVAAVMHFCYHIIQRNWSNAIPKSHKQ